MTRISLALVAGVLLAGCGGDKFWFVDTVDLTLDFIDVPFIKDEDALHGPYVAGSSFTIFAGTRDDDRFTDWTVESSDPDVLVLDDVLFEPETGDLAMDATALGDGACELRLIDADGDIRDTADVEVAVPDHAVLRAAGPLFVDDPSLDAEVEAPQILAGGEATFEVVWMRGNDVLHGNGTLTADVTAGDALVDPEDTFLFEDREWLHVTPTTDATIALSAAGVRVGDFDVRVADAAAIAEVELFGRSEAGLDADDWTVLLAQPFDADGEPIFGVAATWDIDGVAEDGAGDLWRYPFDPADENVVTAHVGELSAEATVHAGEGAFVDSSNNVGCDATGRGPIGVLGAVGVLLAARRR
jgi:hypothetical protein